MSCDRCGRDRFTKDKGQDESMFEPRFVAGTHCLNCGLWQDKYGEVDWDSEDIRDGLDMLLDYNQTGETGMYGVDEIIQYACDDYIDNVIPNLKRLRVLEQRVKAFMDDYE